jgi:hypothetical protein
MNDSWVNFPNSLTNLLLLLDILTAIRILQTYYYYLKPTDVNMCTTTWFTRQHTINWKCTEKILETIDDFLWEMDYFILIRAPRSHMNCKLLLYVFSQLSISDWEEKLLLGKERQRFLPQDYQDRLDQHWHGELSVQCSVFLITNANVFTDVTPCKLYMEAFRHWKNI